MRYYRIELTDKGGEPIRDANGHKIFPLYTIPEKSGENPISSPLQVMFDINTFGLDNAAQGSIVTIYGLPLSMLRQAVNLQGSVITIYAGFSKGLPLANPDQKGIILKGWVWNAYGNWQDINQTLNLEVKPLHYQDDKGNPLNIDMDGKKGEKLSDVIMRTLKRTYPKEKITVNIHQNLVLQEDWPAPFRSLGQMALALRNITVGMKGGLRYSGVRVVAQKGQINVFDSSTEPEPIGFYAQDIIGQPTWVGGEKFPTISVKTPMRSDINVGNRVTLPMNVISGPLSILSVGSQMAKISETDRLNFSGTYIVQSMRHVGDFYNPSGDAWVTILEMAAINTYV